MKKKLVAVIMSLICALSLSACNNDRDNNGGAGGTGNTSNPNTTEGGVVSDAGDIVEDAGRAVNDAGNDISRGARNAVDNINNNMSTTNSVTQR